MIVVDFVGGMCNQFFQYAFGKSLEHHRKCSVRFRYSPDLTGFPYGLDVWNTDVQFGSSTEPVIRERVFRYDAEILKAPDPCTLTGYWQCEKYFLGIEQQIRRDFTPRFELSPVAAKIEQEIRSEPNSVFVHVRRGDYLLPEKQAYHGSLPLGYYLRASEYLTNVCPQPRFFVFSNDPEWVRSKWGYFSTSVVTGTKDYEDLYLMSLCKHAIIANSTFSWWGAWLGDTDKRRIVVAPKRWFATDQVDGSEVVPERWTRL